LQSSPEPPTHLDIRVPLLTENSRGRLVHTIRVQITVMDDLSLYHVNECGRHMIFTYVSGVLFLLSMPIASSSLSTTASDWEQYGIPPRQPSMALWAHLLGKDKLPAPPNSEIIPPPIVPVDKNGTSMRILLHDTQAHLERFSVRADKLCSNVEETKREITTINALFQREHETLRDDIVDLGGFGVRKLDD
jgi:hypothetical protein